MQPGEVTVTNAIVDRFFKKFMPYPEPDVPIVGGMLLSGKNVAELMPTAWSGPLKNRMIVTKKTNVTSHPMKEHCNVVRFRFEKELQ
jgi:hypothetical protein